MDKDPESKQKKSHPNNSSEKDDLLDIFDDIPDLEGLEEDILDLSGEVEELSGTKGKNKNEYDDIIDLFEEADSATEQDLIDLTEDFANFEDEDGDVLSFTDEELRELEDEENLIDLAMGPEASNGQGIDKAGPVAEPVFPARIVDNYVSKSLFDEIKIPFYEKDDELKALIEGGNLSSEDEDIIELTDETEAGTDGKDYEPTGLADEISLESIGDDDEEPIELTEEADAVSALDGDEELIELTELAGLDSAVDEEEELIELTEEAGAGSALDGEEEPIELTEEAGADSALNQEDGPIGLADVIGSDSFEDEEEEFDETADEVGLEVSEENEDELIDLKDELGLALIDAEKDESVELADELGLISIRGRKDELVESKDEADFVSRAEEYGDAVESKPVSSPKDAAGAAEKDEEPLEAVDFESLENIVDGFETRLSSRFSQETGRSDFVEKRFENRGDSDDEKGPDHVESAVPRRAASESRKGGLRYISLSFEKAAAENLGSESDEAKANVGAVNLSEEAIDKALERVIRKVFADKIERILLEAVKKVVTEDIERLKKLILENNGDEDRD